MILKNSARFRDEPFYTRVFFTLSFADWSNRLTITNVYGCKIAQWTTNTNYIQSVAPLCEIPPKSIV